MMKSKEIIKRLGITLGVLAMAGIWGCGKENEVTETPVFFDSTGKEVVLEDTEIEEKAEDIAAEESTKTEEAVETAEVSADTVTAESSGEIDTSAVTDLAINMLKAGEGQNKLVSPMSVMMAMGMCINGAEKDTKEQMLSALGTDEASLNKAMKAAVENADSEDKQLSFANAIWINGSGNVNGDYVQKMDEIFRAEIHEESFGPQTVQNINDFTNNSTDGQIPKLVDRIDNSASMVLVDALCFDGKWDKPFDDYMINENWVFHSADNTVQKVTMLSGGSKEYIEINGAKGFTYSYAGGKYSFIGLLPKEGEAIDKFIAGLNGSDFTKAYENREHTEVIIGIPEFEFDYGMDLCEMFKSLGVKNAFNPAEADFTGMFKNNNGQYISNIIHKTHIALDREGTKAAAVTGMIVLEAAPPSHTEPKEVILDRPFVYMIFDNENKMPLFVGQVDSLKN